MDGDDALTRLRAICMSLPEAAERLSHGEPAWFAGTGRMFACFADHHHDEVLGCWCAAPFGRQQELAGQDPGRYFVPPYVGSRGWLGVRLDVPVDWTEVAEIVQDGYREVASRRLVGLLDAGRGDVSRSSSTDIAQIAGPKGALSTTDSRTTVTRRTAKI